MNGSPVEEKAVTGPGEDRRGGGAAHWQPWATSRTAPATRSSVGVASIATTSSTSRCALDALRPLRTGSRAAATASSRPMFAVSAARACSARSVAMATWPSSSVRASRPSRMRMANTWAAAVSFAASSRWPVWATSFAWVRARLASDSASSTSSAASARRSAACTRSVVAALSSARSSWSAARAATIASSISRRASAGRSGTPLGGPVGGFHGLSVTEQPSGVRLQGKLHACDTGWPRVYVQTQATGAPRPVSSG